MRERSHHQIQNCFLLSVDNRICLWYKHIRLTEKLFLRRKAMLRVSFKSMMCCDARCEMRVRFIMPD